MLTCLLGMTACGQKEEAETAVPLMTEEEAQQNAEQLITQIAQIVDEGMTDYYADNAVLASVFESWEAAMEEMGEYQAITGYDVDIDEEQVVIVADITGTLKNGEVEIVLDDTLNISSITTTVTKTMGELMINAALNTLLGMGTVFAVLILIMFVISGFRIINKLQNKSSDSKKDAVVEKAVDNTIAQIVENEELSDDLELVAVIAAAIAASEGATSTDGFVVRSIKRSNTNKWQRA